jgi:hypothetical protein
VRLVVRFCGVLRELHSHVFSHHVFVPPAGTLLEQLP